jgi:hypothetical protein
MDMTEIIIGSTYSVLFLIIMWGYFARDLIFKSRRKRTIVRIFAPLLVAGLTWLLYSLFPFFPPQRLLLLLFIVIMPGLFVEVLVTAILRRNRK